MVLYHIVNFTSDFYSANFLLPVVPSYKQKIHCGNGTTIEWAASPSNSLGNVNCTQRGTQLPTIAPIFYLLQLHTRFRIEMYSMDWGYSDNIVLPQVSL